MPNNTLPSKQEIDAYLRNFYPEIPGEETNSLSQEMINNILTHFDLPIEAGIELFPTNSWTFTEGIAQFDPGADFGEAVDTTRDIYEKGKTVKAVGEKGKTFLEIGQELEKDEGLVSYLAEHPELIIEADGSRRLALYYLKYGKRGQLGRAMRARRIGRSMARAQRAATAGEIAVEGAAAAAAAEIVIPLLIFTERGRRITKKGIKVVFGILLLSFVFWVLMFSVIYLVLQYQFNNPKGERSEIEVFQGMDVTKTTPVGQLGVSKAVAPDNESNPTSLTYTVQVFNNSENSLSDLKFVDTAGADLCPDLSGSLNSGEIKTCTYNKSYVCQQGTVSNQVTVTATDAENQVNLEAQTNASFGSAGGGDGTAPCGWPVRGNIAQGCTSAHKVVVSANPKGAAVDIMVATETPIISPMDGTARRCGDNYIVNRYGLGATGSLGVYIKVTNANYNIYLAHLTANRPGVVPMPGGGDAANSCGAQVTVKKGQVLGYSGNSGFSSSPHTHYEIISADKGSRCPDPSGGSLRTEGDLSFLEGTVPECKTTSVCPTPPVTPIPGGGQ